MIANAGALALIVALWSGGCSLLVFLGIGLAEWDGRRHFARRLSWLYLALVAVFVGALLVLVREVQP